MTEVSSLVVYLCQWVKYSQNSFLITDRVHFNAYSHQVTSISEFWPVVCQFLWHTNTHRD